MSHSVPEQTEQWLVNCKQTIPRDDQNKVLSRLALKRTSPVGTGTDSCSTRGQSSEAHAVADKDESSWTSLRGE
jgi:hypothetical protein